jgi:cell division protein FtsB
MNRWRIGIMKQGSKNSKSAFLNSNRFFWILTCAVVLLSALAVSRGTMQMIWAQDELIAIQKVNAELIAQNSILKKKVGSLKTDRKALESIIRQDLGMVKTGEVVYLEPEINQGTP